MDSCIQFEKIIQIIYEGLNRGFSFLQSSNDNWKKYALLLVLAIVLYGLVERGFSLLNMRTRRYLSRVVLIVRVYDGDTIKTSKGEKIRLLGIDAPEIERDGKPNQIFAVESRDFVANLIKGKKVKLVPERPYIDEYGRTLAWVYCGKHYGTLLNAYIIKEGYGYSFKKHLTSKLDDFNLLEEEAKKAKKGMWAKGADWRTWR